jgi:hypothetical protein
VAGSNRTGRAAEDETSELVAGIVWKCGDYRLGAFVEKAHDLDEPDHKESGLLMASLTLT